MKVPLPYRLLFLYIEPIAALGGTYLCLTQPLQFLQTFSPGAVDYPAEAYSPLSQPIYDQAAALLLLFAWCQAVVLRSTSDLRVWKAVLFGMFLCDLVHLWGQWRILGPEVFLDARLWRREEWLNFVMLYGPGGMRVAFCAEVGF